VSTDQPLQVTSGAEGSPHVRRTLSPELVSLVHHIELNRSGWWDLGVRRLILAAFWLSSEPEGFSPERIAKILQENFSVALDPKLIAAQLRVLHDQKTVLHLPTGFYKMSEEATATYEAELQEADALQQRVLARFKELLSERCPELDPDSVWQQFLDVFLVPLVKNLGANTYRLITQSALTLDKPYLPEFTAQFQERHAQALKRLATDFLDPKDSDTRSFVLRSMNAFFFVQASSLDQKTIAALSRDGKRFTATIFVDTNFIFSLLGLHENPADEAAAALLTLITRLRADHPIRLYALPPTLDEATRVISAAQAAALRFQPTPNLVDAALETGMVGLTGKYLKLVAASKRPIDPHDYFGPFISNLMVLLRARGVELFNQDLSLYKTRQDVIDDLLSRLAFEKRKYGGRAKTYEELEHDTVIWHFVKDKRPVRTESPLEAGYWIVTIDYRFLGFDAYLNKSEGSQLPLCLHPAMLAQLLQFWVPRTPEFEAALLGAMRLPLLFSAFDAGAEVVTVQILQALSRFEDVGSLPKETVRAILLNDALRQRIASERDINKQIELVREALIEEHKSVALKLREADEKGAKLAEAVEEQKRAIAELARTVEAGAQHIDAARAETEALRFELSGLKEADAARRTRGRFALQWVLSPAVIVSFVVPIGASRFTGGWTPRFWFWSASSWCLCLAALFWVVERQGSKNPLVASWRLFEQLRRFRKFLYGALILPMLSRMVWELGRHFW
jgi:hypothetical protein